jgi:hypothetical protein
LKEREKNLSKDNPWPGFPPFSILKMAVCSFPSVTPKMIICYSHICALEREINVLPYVGTATDCITVDQLN